MIRLVALAVLFGSLYLALLGKVQQMDDMAMDQIRQLREYRATQ